MLLGSASSVTQSKVVIGPPGIEVNFLLRTAISASGSFIPFFGDFSVLGTYEVWPVSCSTVSFGACACAFFVKEGRGARN